MVKSIQYFNENSVPVFEKLEDEFLKDPSDIASYVTKLTEELHKTGIRMIEETLGYLDQMLNESEVRKMTWIVDRHEPKQLITSLGSVNYSKTMFRDKEEGSRSYLLDLIMGMEPHERMTEDAEARLLEEAVQTSDQRGGEETSIGDSFPFRHVGRSLTVPVFVRFIGRSLAVAVSLWHIRWRFLPVLLLRHGIGGKL